MKIAIFGGSGFIGAKLSSFLLNEKFNLLIIDRNKPKLNVNFIKCDLLKEDLDLLQLENFDVFINLLGRNIFTRWNKKIKEEIYNSRVITTRKIVDYISRLNKKPKILISNSAVGYYGQTKENQIVNEENDPGNDFLANLCYDWENEVKKVSFYNVKYSIIRLAPVLSYDALIIKNNLKILKFGLNIFDLKSNNYMPWIHVKDLLNVYLFIIKNEISEVLNVVSPYLITYKDFILTLAKILNKRIILTIPKFINKLILGELYYYLNYNQKISCKKLIDLGFKFEFNNIDEALKNILLRKN